MALEEAIDADCRAYRGGHTAVCAILGEPYGPFQKRISTAYPEHHLHAPDVARVVELVRGPAVRQWFEQVYGVSCYTVQPVEASRDALLALGRYLQQEAGYVSSVAEGAADGIWERPEVEDLERHTWVLVGQLLGILAGARQAMEARAHG
ncbi:hypothetical protein D9M70_424960 [compost metagenome]